jgi:D-serine deaminase-like pyridoxal phosphate-dependent protein
MQIEAGIRTFKCATLAEAQMLAHCGAEHVLVAYSLAGPSRTTFARLIARQPATRFGVLVDNLRSVELLEAALEAEHVTADAYVDLDVGMHRTGLPVGPDALQLFERLAASKRLRAAGLHAYDGHLKQRDPLEREQASDARFAAVDAMAATLRARRYGNLEVIAGGSPTFAIHARHPDRILSPGTCVFWDWAYATKFPDLDFLHAALALTRVISRPTPDTLCLDLGYKAVSPDNPSPRVALLQIPDAEMLIHSEEHLLIRTARAGDLDVDDCLYGIPYHICPTVALYDYAYVVAGGRIVDRWQVVARRRDVDV